jgi:hypothetical protein
VNASLVLIAQAWTACASRLTPGTVLQYGCAGVQPPAQARQGVAQLAMSSTDYVLAWKGPPSNTLVTWGEPFEPAKQVLASLTSAVGGKPLTGLVQMSAGSSHALLLQASGSLVVGYAPGMKGAALPPSGLIKGRLARVSAGNSYSLGVDTGQ